MRTILILIVLFVVGWGFLIWDSLRGPRCSEYEDPDDDDDVRHTDPT